jgi:hypothetical protein
MAKRGDEWFPLSQAVVAYDHARHVPLVDVITLHFINTYLDPGARAGIELTLETAKELRAALDGRSSPPSMRRRKCGARASCSTLFELRDIYGESAASASGQHVPGVQLPSPGPVLARGWISRARIMPPTNGIGTDELPEISAAGTRNASPWAAALG